MDFFSNVSSDLQTPWKEMLLHRADNLYCNDFALKYPEIEAQLKLFYTAVTRCIERLFFVEESTSKAGDAFIRWSTTTSVTPFGPNDKIDKAIATLSDCSNIESMSMNRDEWLAAGLSNAEAADAEEYDYENKCSFLKKAVYCFEQGRHDLFVRKAKVQLRSIELRMKVSDIDVEDVDLCQNIEKEAVCIARGLLEADMGSEVLELSKSLRDITNNLYPSSDFLRTYLIMNVQSTCESQRKVERELCDQNEPHSKPSAKGPRKDSISECTYEKEIISKTPENVRDEEQENEPQKVEPLGNSPCSVVQSLFSTDEFLSDLEKTFQAADTKYSFTLSNPQEEVTNVNNTPITKTCDEVSFDFGKNSSSGRSIYSSQNQDVNDLEIEEPRGKRVLDSLRGLFVFPIS